MCPHRAVAFGALKWAADQRVQPRARCCARSDGFRAGGNFREWGSVYPKIDFASQDVISLDKLRLTIDRDVLVVSIPPDRSRPEQRVAQPPQTSVQNLCRLGTPIPVAAYTGAQGAIALPIRGLVPGPCCAGRKTAQVMRRPDGVLPSNPAHPLKSPASQRAVRQSLCCRSIDGYFQHRQLPPKHPVPAHRSGSRSTAS